MEKNKKINSSTMRSTASWAYNPAYYAGVKITQLFTSAALPSFILRSSKMI
jgi:hypothetical protein